MSVGSLVRTRKSRAPKYPNTQSAKQEDSGRLRFQISIHSQSSLSTFRYSCLCICSAFQKIFIQEFNGFSLVDAVGAILVVVGEGPTQVSLLFSQHLCRPRKKASSKLT
ncbi:hypothetical protein HanRHA438_Chr14g0672331 [Helianthus annuus]|nr:hypothetical protein HanRHA438_Chr14g0672331 [Helianthus annuus]